MVLSSAIVCNHDRRIADDRRSSFHMIADDRRPYCDLRSYGNQPLDRTWFYLLRSRSQDRRRSQTLLRSAICNLRSAIIWKPALTQRGLYSGRMRNARQFSNCQYFIQALRNHRRLPCSVNSPSHRLTTDLVD